MIIPHIILKNMKIIFRSPFTVLLLILAPILLMFTVGLAYSGIFLTDTHIGLINTNEDLFQIKGVDFNNYNGESAVQDCVLALKKSEVDMCIYFNSVYQDNRIESANIIYYIDDTRPLVSDILTRNFNNILDAKTNEISKKTIEDIFVEVKDTVNFMNESAEVVDKINNDLDVAKNNILSFKKEFTVSKTLFDTQYPTILNLIGELKISLRNNNENIDILVENLENLEKSLDNLNDDLPDLIDITENTIDGIENYAFLVDPAINNYVNINDLTYMKTSLEILNNNVKDNKNTINSAIESLDNIPDSSEMIENLDLLEESLIDLDENLDVAEELIDNVLTNIETRQSEINKIKSEIDNKIDYFNELSNKDAASITQPIKKEYIHTFDSNFSRVHQLAPIVVILVLLFIGLLLSNIVVSLEVNSKAYFRNLISPIPQWKFILSLFFTSFIIILFQILFLFVILDTYFGIKLYNVTIPLISNIQHMSQIFIVILHLLIIFILIGIFLAYLFSSIQVSILVTTFVMLFMFLLSEIIVPLNIMPSFFASLVKLNPVVMGSDLIRLLFFYSKYYSLRFLDLIIFYPYIFILTLLVLLANQRRKKKLF